MRVVLDTDARAQNGRKMLGLPPALRLHFVAVCGKHHLQARIRVLEYVS